jgi:hypothetical protein
MKSIQVAQLVAICDLHDVLLKGFVSVSSFPSGTASSARLACIITGVTCFTVVLGRFDDSFVLRAKKKKKKQYFCSSSSFSDARPPRI